jgi:hypothetical protein
VPTVLVPTHTFVGVAHAVTHAGFPWKFNPQAWGRDYRLNPLGIVDSAVSLCRGMCLEDSVHLDYCLSFQCRKPLPIGRGGMILTADAERARWYRMARWHGRDPETHKSMFAGWPLKMEPERAARGLELMSRLDDQNVSTPRYHDLSLEPAFKDVPLCEAEA